MSTLRCTPLHDDFGARVTGIELGEPISSVQIEGIRAAIDEYSLLVFPDQQMTDEAQLALTSQLGEPEAEHVTLGRTGETVHFGTVGNISADGSQHGNEAASTRYQKGNQLWHSDSSFREVPSYVTITHGYEVVGEGGETEFVSARAAYDRLDSADRDLVDPLEAVHDYLFSRSPVAPVHPAHAASIPPVAHRLVRTNPGNGRQNLFVGSHVRSVVGWGGIESRELLDRLVAHTTHADAVYAHAWSTDDTVIWDNRCLIHRGRPYDADRWRRRMRQTRVVGAERGRIH
ncbi:MAG: TauD/TfdA family dioxygenase [Actinomycetota bacterium]|nr:TauD/TfdA family dioxygenase [Actinomycetota bacterium]